MRALVFSAIGFLVAATAVGAPLPGSTACPSGNELFVRAPFDTRGVLMPGGTIPLGRMTPEGDHIIPTRHLYTDQRFMTPGDPSTKIPFTAYAPANVELVAVEHRKTLSADDWSLYMKPCSQVIFYYFHIEEPDPALLARFTKTASNTMSFGEGTMTQVNILLEAGMPLGKAKKAPLMWGVEDFRVQPLPFVNKARYTADFKYVMAELEIPAAQIPLAEKLLPHIVPQALYNRCPIDYFTKPIRDQLTPMLADGIIKATGTPPCHSHMQDVAGTAQGNWWQDIDPKNALFDETNAIALANWNVKPAVQVFSLNRFNTGLTAALIGSDKPLKEIRTVFEFSAGIGKRNQPFAKISDTNSIYCYDGLRLLGTQQTLKGIILIQLTSIRAPANGLHFEIQPDKTCATERAWAFTSAKKTFHR